MKNLTLSGLLAVDENGEEYFIKFPEPYTPSTVITYTYPDEGGTGQIVDVPTPGELQFAEEKLKRDSTGVEAVLSKHKKNEK